MGEFRYVGLAVLESKARTAIRHALVQSANDLVAQAVQAAPVEEGTLRGSIHKGEVEGGPGELRIQVGTGGEASAYAVYQHEGHRADGSHVIRNHPGGGGTKYIENPLKASAPVYREALARAARGEF